MATSADGWSRRLLTAEILSIGSELTVGDTRDTNASEIARSLTAAGVTVGRITAVPDRLEVVAEAFTAAAERADLVVSTGGLGPTPDDLTREAIARRPRRDPDRRSGPGPLAAPPVVASRTALPGAQPQAGLADPARHGARQPERHGPGLVCRAPGRPA